MRRGSWLVLENTYANTRWPQGERVASLAVGPDAIYFGTISPDIFTRGRLSKLVPSTGATTVLDPAAQVSWIGLGATAVYYVADVVQSPSADLWFFASAVHGTGRQLLASSDFGFRGIVILDSLDERALLIVLEQHLLHRAFGGIQNAPQHGQESAFLLRLVVVVAKRAQKSQEDFDVIVLQRLMVFGALCHFLQHIQSTQKDFVFLSE